MQYKHDDDWRALGDDVMQTVQDAISSGNYSNLSNDIARIADRVVDNVSNSISDSMANKRSGQQRRDDPGNASTMQDINGRNQSGAYQAFEPNTEWKDTRTSQYISRINAERAAAAAKQASRPVMQRPSLYEKFTLQKALSIAGMAVGFSFGGIMGIIMLICLIAPFNGHVSAAALLAVFTAAGFTGGISGSGVYGRIKRFEKYVALLGEKTYADIKALAASTGKSAAYVKKDLKKMIARHWFHQGHISDDGTSLIVTDETYQQYLLTCSQQKAIEENRAKEEAETSKLSPEAREMIAQGEEFLRDIHQCNDDIPGEEISAKIDRMERSVGRIFERAKEHPELVGELRRMMSYYLPTTVKLLRAYADMDRQEVKGENIENSKKEIESTIDTLNDAFDRLFDSMFQDTSLDVSTDATVMKNMLAQEGLTGHDFTSADVIGQPDKSESTK